MDDIDPIDASLDERIFDDFAVHVAPGRAETLRRMGIVFPFGKREGVYVWDAAGTRRLINCHCNGGTFNLGHRHPVLVETLVDALGADDGDIGNHHFPSAPRARLGRRLAELAPGPLETVVFASAGGEAVDVALKVARKKTGRRRIVSARGGYHGHTGLAVAAGDAKYSRPFLIDTRDFVQVPWNDLEAMRAVLGEGEPVAAVILETIPATLGMPLPAPGYLAAVKALCAEAGALYIADEVQTGLGRTGKLWAVEHEGVEPDVLVTAKGLSGGLYPIAATLMTRALGDVFRDDPWSHIATFGGADLGCVVAEKVLDISSQPDFLAHVQAMSARIVEGLEAVRARMPEAGLVEIRARGAFMGLKFKGPMDGLRMSKLTFDAGLLCFFAGHDPSVLQLLPPLVTDLATADEIVARMESALMVKAGR